MKLSTTIFFAALGCVAAPLVSAELLRGNAPLSPKAKANADATRHTNATRSLNTDFVSDFHRSLAANAPFTPVATDSNIWDMVLVWNAFASWDFRQITISNEAIDRLIAAYNARIASGQNDPLDLGTWDISRLSYNLQRLVGLETQYVDLESPPFAGHVFDDTNLRDLVDAYAGIDRPEENDRAKKLFGAIGDWNVSQVTDMDKMFESGGEQIRPSKEIFDESLASWDMSKVTTMDEMFSGLLHFNQDLSSWDVSSVTSMSWTFYNAISFNQNLESWNVSSVTSMARMFHGASYFNGGLNAWDTSNVETMLGMFAYAIVFDQPLDSWSVESVTSMAELFNQALEFNQPLGAWQTGGVTSMERAFHAAQKFNQDLALWNTSGVTSMEEMFRFAAAFNQDLDDWDVGAVVDFSSMFSSATSFDQNLDSWDLSSAGDMSEMFSGAAQFEQQLCWNTIPDNLHFLGQTRDMFADTQASFDPCCDDVDPSWVGGVDPGKCAFSIREGVVSLVDHNPKRVYFFPEQEKAFDERPVVLAHLQTTADTDTGVLQVADLQTWEMYVFVEEEHTSDVEAAHTQELGGFLALSGDIVTDTTGGVVAETGKVSGVKFDEFSVAFSTQFTEPPVVMAQMTPKLEQAPGLVQITQVTNTGFSMKVVNWDGSFHLTEEFVSYVAVAPGAHTLKNGFTLQAQTKAMDSTLGENLVDPRTASQSSMPHGGLASRATDGNTDGVWSRGSVTHTGKEQSPWWQVDLVDNSPDDCFVVVLWNRVDCCRERLRNVIVSLLDEDGEVLSAIQYQGSVVGEQRIPITFGFPNDPKSVSAVKASLPGVEYLSLAEVEVFQCDATFDNGVMVAAEFPHVFQQTPLVFSQTQTANDAITVTTRMNNVSPSGLDLALQEAELLEGTHDTTEVVGIVSYGK